MNKNKYTRNWKEVLETILELSKERGRGIPIKELIRLGVIGDNRQLDNYLKNETIYTDYKDFYRKHGYCIYKDVFINGKVVEYNEITVEDFEFLFKDYKQKIGQFPTSDIFKSDKKFPSWNIFQQILNKYNLTLKDFYLRIGNIQSTVMTDVKDYNKFIKRFKETCKKLNRVIKHNELNHTNNFNLPSPKWFIDYCPDKNVKSYPDFLHWLGYINTYNITKEETIKIVYNMQKELNRPLMYDDFRNPTEDTIGITTIKKYWGTMNKMKEELGLEIIQEDMVSKTPTMEQAKIDIKNVCNKIYLEDGRKMITSKDINNNCSLRMSAYSKIFKKYNTTLRKYIDSIGFELQKEGNGLNYFFDDGEKIRSQYELDFSKFLRNKLNLQYNKDYYRDIRYKKFIDAYNGLLDCDYVIYWYNRIIYIEVVGMLRDYKNNWKTIELKSKSKTKYIEHLKQKEQMFIDNHLEYYILFPSDLQEDFLLSIFSNKLNERGR